MGGYPALAGDRGGISGGGAVLSVYGYCPFELENDAIMSP